MPAFRRFVAVGDSITEGLTDPYGDGVMRGWADRVADVLAREPGFTYANLAVRGRKLDRVVGEQLPVALSLVTGADTLVSFHAGANNILRPGYEPAVVRDLYSGAVAELRATGATVLVFTVQEVRGRDTRMTREWNRRFGEFNAMVRDVAAQHGAVLMDGNSVDVFYDPRLLAADRLHLNSEGHRRVAAAVLERLGLPHDGDWRDPLPGTPTPPGPVRTAVWLVVFLVPWLLRRVTGRSSGDDREAKHPVPVAWPR